MSGGLVREENLFDLKVYHSIRELDVALWDRWLGCLHPTKSHEFLSVVESAFPERQYRYYCVYKKQQPEAGPVAVFFSCEYSHDLILGAGEPLMKTVRVLRKIIPGFGCLRIVMSGNPETHSDTWWFDESAVSVDQLHSLMSSAIKAEHSSARLVLIRDFNRSLAEFPTVISSIFYALKFKLTQSLPLALLDIKGIKPKDHLARLKQNYRKIIKKALSKFDSGGYKVLRAQEFLQWVDALYPLYLNVHARAKEFVREPFDKTFFHQLSNASCSELTLILNKDDEPCAFTISVYNETVYNAYLFGCKETTGDEPSFYTCLMWFDLENACERELECIDMGITNYFPKQNFGAHLVPLTMALTLRSPLRGLNPLFAKLLCEQQPASRSVYRSV